MDSPAPPSDQVRHIQVGGGEIPAFQHLEHYEQSPFMGVTTRPLTGMKNTDKNVLLRKRSHKAVSRREDKLRNGNSWQGPGQFQYTDNVGTEQPALPAAGA